MSSTFDTMQMALDWLEEHIDPDDDQAMDVIFYAKEVVDTLHNYSHKTGDAPNRAAGPETRLLRTALEHEDDEDRKLWLAVKME